MIVCQGDEQWLDIVNWMLLVLLFVEQEGIDFINVVEVKVNFVMFEIVKMLGVMLGFGMLLGFLDDWVFNVILKVGNYFQIFECGLGL